MKRILAGILTILAFALLTGAPAWALTYFGECNPDGSLLGTPSGSNYGGPAYVANINETYTAPGAGVESIVSIGAYLYGISPYSAFSMAVYDSSWNLVCQWSSSYTPTNASAAWYDSAALAGACKVTGGNAYHICCTQANNYTHVGQNSGSVYDWEWASTSYTGGWPGTLPPPGTGGAGGRLIVRVGVTSAWKALPQFMEYYRRMRGQ